MEILLARPREDAERLAAKLAARGHHVLIEPLINVVPVPGADVPLDGVQAVLFTSANGARAFATASDRRDLDVLAVGDATAEAARGQGFTKVESAGGDVHDLARLARERLDPARGALLHAAGSAVAGDLTGTLEQAGFSVRRVVLYGAWPVDRLSAPGVAAIAARAVDVAILFSPRSAETFVRLVRDAGLADAMARVVLLGLSNAVVEAGAELPWSERIAAEHPDEDSLLMEIDRLAQQRGAAPPVAASPALPPAPAAPAPAPAPRARRNVAGTLALLAAVVALAWALWIDWRLRSATPPADPAPRLAALEQRIATLPSPQDVVGATASRVDALERQVQTVATAQDAGRDAAQAASAAREAAAALAERVAPLERRAAQLVAAPAADPAIPPEWAARIETLERRVTLVQAAAQAGAQGGAPAGAAAAPAGAGAPSTPPDDRAAAMERTLGSVEESLARISSALAALERRIAALEAASRSAAGPAAAPALRGGGERPSGAGDPGRASEAAAQTAAGAGAAQRLAFSQLRDAIARGVPFEVELAALRAARADAAVTALAPIADAAARGIPTLPALAGRFGAVADAIVRAEGSAETPWWWLPVERVRSMVSARPVGDVPGTAPGAIAARAELRLARGDLAGALRELEGLQGAAAAAAAPWRRDAVARAEADAILARLGAELAGQ